jgi:NAD-dependent dihydropyrimidine dehydrogenase PreA subunit
MRRKGFIGDGLLSQGIEFDIGRKYRRLVSFLSTTANTVFRVRRRSRSGGIWDLDQIPARGIEQIKEWYAGFPVKASACVECGVCLERCPFDAHTEYGAAKMCEAAAVFEEQAA